MENKDKLIRKFKDTNNNEYKIIQKNNKNYYLVIYKNGAKNGTIITGSKYEIFSKLKEIHKGTKFIN
jgi:hypothetical protein